MTQKKKNEGKLANNTKKPIAITELEAKLSNLFISEGEDATQNFNNTNQMDVDCATCHFQEEILMDILSRLPVRSLLRFKCVSNIWKTLIFEPYFKMKHLNFAKNNQGSQKLLINQSCPNENIPFMYCCPLSPVQLIEDAQKLKLDCPSNPKPRSCAIHCCYDGLVIIEVTDILDYDRITLLLWNPSTRESIVIPAPESTHDAESRFGLGYDSTSGDYKILHIHQDVRDCKLPYEILALKSGSWRRINKHPRGFNSLVFAMQFLAFVHAAFHWIATSENCFVVVSFSISNELYGEIPLPEEMLRLRVNSRCISVSVLEGMLCVDLNSYMQRNATYKLWVLKKYGVKGSWMPLLTIQDPSIYKIVPKYRFADGEVLFCCSSEESVGCEFRTTSGPFVSWPRCDVEDGYAFTESLISPKSLTN